MRRFIWQSFWLRLAVTGCSTRSGLSCLSFVGGPEVSSCYAAPRCMLLQALNRLARPFGPEKYLGTIKVSISRPSSRT
jgi:hypothetical protein